MTLLTRKQAVAAALATNTNVPGTCQKVTRGWFNAPSAGDRDGDKDADAVDGWLSEPKQYRHTDRKPPRGTPVAWSGGRNGYGHRALSLGPDANGVYWIRSTDAPNSGRVGTVKLEWVEKNWGLKYLGWSETISGQLIQGSDPKPVKVKKSRGQNVDKALAHLRRSLRYAKKGSLRRAEIERAIDSVEQIDKTH